MLLIRLMTGFGRRIIVSWNWHSKKKKKFIMPIKASKKKPTTELQKEKKKPGSSFRHKMRSAASANGLGVSGSSCLLQIALIAAEWYYLHLCSNSFRQRFPEAMWKTASTISLVNSASGRGHICIKRSRRSTPLSCGPDPWLTFGFYLAS